MFSAYINRIQEVYPEIVVQDVKQNEIGQNNDVIILNDSFVFRFPKYEQGLLELIKETKSLEAIRDHLSLSVPNPVYQSFDAMEVGKAFMGYKLINGSSFWKEDLLNIKNGDIEEEIAAQLVTFLIELHSLDISKIISSQVPPASVNEEVEQLFVRIKDNLFTFIRKEAQKEIEDNFTSFLNKHHNEHVKHAFVHGDFGAGNILWKRDECRIVGIIDFGGSGLGDPAYDLAGLLSSYGKDFFEKCINLYPGGRQIAERVHFYRSTFALQEALHGLEHGDPEAFENGIKDFR